MADEHGAQNDLRDLSRMAREGEEAAQPLPPERVRALGDHRRRRRYGLVAAGLVVGLVLAGGVAVGTGLLRGNQTVPPPIADSPSAAPSEPTEPTTTPSKPARPLSTRHLLTVDDVPIEDWENTVAVLAKEGTGRSVAESSICLPGRGLADLNAVQQLHRNFRHDYLDRKNQPDIGPLKNEPVVYTQVLQFADAEAAEIARDRYTSWLKGCEQKLKAAGYDVLDDLVFTDRGVRVPYGEATVSEIVYRRPGDVDGENGFWESVGLVLVKDRLAINIYLHYGQDFVVTMDESEGDLLHPQLGLVLNSSERIAR
jgi:hypothetical protein